MPFCRDYSVKPKKGRGAGYMIPSEDEWTGALAASEKHLPIMAYPAGASIEHMNSRGQRLEGLSTALSKMFHCERARASRGVWQFLAAVAISIAALLLVRSYVDGQAAGQQVEMGLQYIEEGKYNKAVDAFNQAIEVDSSSVNARIGLIRAYERSERQSEGEQAARDLLDEIGISGMSTGEIIELAQFYVDNAEFNRGVSIIRSAREIYPYDQQLKDFQSNMASSGNSQPNIMNGGLASAAGGWIFYSVPDQGIFRMKPTGDSRQKISNDRAGYINATSEWIYYVSYSDRGCLYRIRPDGSCRQKLNGDLSCCPALNGDYLYYICRNESVQGGCGSLYRVRRDGIGREQIGSTTRVQSYGFWDGKIYYTDESGKLGCMGMDGSALTALWDLSQAKGGACPAGSLANICIDGNYACGVYTASEPAGSNRTEVVRFNQQGKIIQFMGEPAAGESIHGLGLYSEGILYSVHNQQGGTATIRRMSGYGDKSVELTGPQRNAGIDNYSLDSICVLDGWFYYLVRNPDTNGLLLMRTRTDGSVTETLS